MPFLLSSSIYEATIFAQRSLTSYPHIPDISAARRKCIPGLHATGNLNIALT